MKKILFKMLSRILRRWQALNLWTIWSKKDNSICQAKNHKLLKISIYNGEFIAA